MEQRINKITLRSTQQLLAETNGNDDRDKFVFFYSILF